MNLAGPDPDFFERSVEVLARELQMAPGFGAAFVNVHTGSHRAAGVRAGTERIAEGVARSLAATDDRPDDAVLLLENSAGGGFGLGATVDELAGIARAIADCGIPDRRVGFCLDTAHAWGAGYRLSDPDATDELLAEFDQNRAATIQAVEAADEALLARRIRSAGGVVGPLALVFHQIAVAHVLGHARDIARDDSPQVAGDPTRHG